MAPADILRELANDESLSVVKAVAENSRTPSEVLARLASHADRSVRYYIARNPSTPSELLKVLTSDSDREVVRAVATNPNTPQKDLEALVAKFLEANLFLEEAASNPSLSTELLVKFVTKPGPVQRAALKNPSFPNELRSTVKLSPIDRGLADAIAATTDSDLKPLRTHKIKSVQTAALIRSYELGLVSPTDVRAQIKGSSGTSALQQYLSFAAGYEMHHWPYSNFPWGQRQSSMSDEGFVKICLDLGNEHCLGTAMDAGLRLTSNQVAALGTTKQFQWVKNLLLRQMYADQAGSPEVIITALELKADRVLAHLIRYGEADRGLLLQISQAGLAQATWEMVQKVKLDGELLSALVTVPSWSVESRSEPDLVNLAYPDAVDQGDEWTTFHTQYVAATHPDTPAEAVATLAKAKSAFVRAALAARTDLAPTLVAKLAKDKDASVRAAAAANPVCPERALTALAADLDPEVRTAAATSPNATDDIRAIAALVN